MFSIIGVRGFGRSFDLPPRIRRPSLPIPIIKDYPYTETTAECPQNLKPKRNLI